MFLAYGGFEKCSNSVHFPDEVYDWASLSATMAFAKVRILSVNSLFCVASLRMPHTSLANGVI